MIDGHAVVTESAEAEGESEDRAVGLPESSRAWTQRPRGRGGGGDRRPRPAGRWRSPASWVRTRCASTAGLRRPDEGSASSGHIRVTASLLRGASGHGVREGGGWLPTPRMWSQRLPRVNTAAAQLLPPAPGPFCHSARSHPPPPPRAQRLSSRPRRRTRAAAGLRAGPRLARPPAPRFRACPVLREMTSAASPQTRVAGEGRVPMPAPAPTGSQILCSVDVQVQPCKASFGEPSPGTERAAVCRTRD